MADGSASQFLQGGRLIEIDTTLGTDKLLLVQLAGEEEISCAFLFQATMFSDDPAIASDQIIGKPVTIWIRRQDGQLSPINGIVRRFAAGPVDARGLREYRADIVPWFWLLTCTSDCRIFQNKSFPAIMEQVLDEYGFHDYELNLTATYPPLDYCVQYRESVFDFLSRWMEKLGIFYFFRHEADRHVMVVGDNNPVFKFVADKDADYATEQSNVTRWQHAEEFRAGRYVQTDFAFKTPSLDLLTQDRTVRKIARAQDFEIFDFPAGYTEVAHGKTLTRTRIEEEEARCHTVEGDSQCPSFGAGGKFAMARHAIATEEGKSYILTRVVHAARDESHYASNAEVPSYSNSFVAVPAETPFRPERRTPWPVVQGPQTAIVVGTKGEIIDTEKHGRVKLHFHWDRRGHRDETSSCWVRVSQNTAGAGWGGVFIPHIGHEVVVSFLEGDPDRPLVTGRVYNAENTNSLGLPTNKTQSAIRDHSGNEIVMEGKSGSQDIRVHAVKDMHVTVDNDREMHVKAHLTETVDQGQEVTVKKGYKETITESATSTISGGLTSTVNGGWTSTIHGKFTETATDGEERTVSSGKKLTVTGGGSTEDVTGERAVTVTGAIKQSSTTTTDLHATGAGTYTSDASLTFSVGQSTIKITPTAITITAGPSSISLDPSGVAVTGPKISLNG